MELSRKTWQDKWRQLSWVFALTWVCVVSVYALATFWPAVRSRLPIIGPNKREIWLFAIAFAGCVSGLLVVRIWRARAMRGVLILSPLALTFLLTGIRLWGGSAFLASGCLVVARRSISLWGSQLRQIFQAPPLSWFTLGCYVSLALFFTFNLLFGLTPEIVFDALKSHLALAKIFSLEHQGAAPPYSMGSYWLLGGEMLFALAYQLGGETTAKLLHLLAGILAAATGYVLGKRLHSSMAGVATTTVFWSESRKDVLVTLVTVTGITS